MLRLQTLLRGTSGRSVLEDSLRTRRRWRSPFPRSMLCSARSLSHPFPKVRVPRSLVSAASGGRAYVLADRGVYTTAVGYAGGFTPNPTYQEVCSGRTGHTEAVLVVFDPEKVSYRELLAVFWEAHDPTQGMRQGNDIGTQYRSAIYYTGDEQRRTAEETRDAYEQALWGAGYGQITTEIAPAGPFYYAEVYHQQYLHKVPNGYCGLGGTGVSCPVGEIPGRRVEER